MKKSKKIFKIYAFIFLLFFMFCFLGYFFVENRVDLKESLVRVIILSLIVSIITGTVIVLVDKFMKKKKYFNWQKIIIFIIGILTSISISLRDINIDRPWKLLSLAGYSFDLIIGVSINIAVLIVIFLIGNSIYFKTIKKELKKINVDGNNSVGKD